MRLKQIKTIFLLGRNKVKDLLKKLKFHIHYQKVKVLFPTMTGAYLLGFDLIKIVGKSPISISDRESVRGSMRRLVGMEIIDEDATNISVQFLLDETSVNPQNILKRMSSIALGMFSDVISSLQSGDKTNLETISNRDAEINRQYFLLVRLIRSTIMDTRLAGIF